MTSVHRPEIGNRRTLLALGLMAALVALGPSCQTSYTDTELEAQRVLEKMKGSGIAGDAETAPEVDASLDVSEEARIRELMDRMSRDGEASEPGTTASSESVNPDAGSSAPETPSVLPTDEEVALPDILAPTEPEPGLEVTPAKTGDSLDLTSAQNELARVLGNDPTAPSTTAPSTGAPTSPETPSAVSPPAASGEEKASPVAVAAETSGSSVIEALEDDAGPTLRSGGTPTPAVEEKPKPPRPEGKIEFFTFHHKLTGDFMRFLAADFPDYLEKGHVATIDGKPNNVMFFGDDPTLASLLGLAASFDDMGLKLEKVPIRPRYIDVKTLMESLTLASVANVWSRVHSNVTTQAIHGGKWKTVETFQQNVFSKGGISHGQEAPLPLGPKVPYVFEMPSKDPFKMPRVSTGRGSSQQETIEFNESSSTEMRGVMMAVGTAEDIEKIQAFVDSVDRPARRVMIEVQLIELDADHLSDIGLDSVSFGKRATLGSFSAPFPGESIVQPGVPDALRRPGIVVPDLVQEGLGFIIDDTADDISGRFMANIHLLTRQGDAKIKARPKILTLDDRPSILHIGDEVPTFTSTSVNREVTGGTFVEQINNVSTQYVGFTLNMRPRVSGDDNDEIALQLEVVSNQLRGRERVFAEDLLGIPIVSQRKFFGQTRVKNHRPIILGGLIQEEDVESTAKVPFLGDIPVLGRLFTRVQKEQRRTEVILVVTPHILSESGWDPAATPKESIHFDTFDSVLFNDRYILKGRDVWGIDPITKQPAMMNGEIFSEEEIVDLTLLNIVKRRELVTKLRIFEEYIPDEAAALSWAQRRAPERTVSLWPEELQVIYYKAAAIVIENIKELNYDLTFDEIVLPRREIVLPTTPYRMTLTYNKYKTYVDKGAPVLRDNGARLTQKTIDLLREVAQTRSVRQFAEYVARNDIGAERHNELRWELQRLHRTIYPESNDSATDSYIELLNVLAESGIDFVAWATFFQQNLEERYLTRGAPKIGTFEIDLENFLQTSVTISQRARRLRDLDTKWSIISEGEDEGEVPDF